MRAGFLASTLSLCSIITSSPGAMHHSNAVFLLGHPLYFWLLTHGGARLNFAEFIFYVFGRMVAKDEEPRLVHPVPRSVSLLG